MRIKGADLQKALSLVTGKCHGTQLCLYSACVHESCFTLRSLSRSFPPLASSPAIFHLLVLPSHRPHSYRNCFPQKTPHLSSSLTLPGMGITLGHPTYLQRSSQHCPHPSGPSRQSSPSLLPALRSPLHTSSMQCASMEVSCRLLWAADVT